MPMRNTRSITYRSTVWNTRDTAALRIGTRMRLMPCSTALVTVDSEYTTTAEEPRIVIRISIALSLPGNSRPQMGAASTVSPTAEGMAMIMEKRTALAIFPSTCLRSRSATALERDGIREEDRELATATGMLNSRWYFPEYTPQWAAISCPSPNTVFTWPNRMLSTTLTLL